MSAVLSDEVTAKARNTLSSTEERFKESQSTLIRKVVKSFMTVVATGSILGAIATSIYRSSTGQAAPSAFQWAVTIVSCLAGMALAQFLFKGVTLFRGWQKYTRHRTLLSLYLSGKAKEANNQTVEREIEHLNSATDSLLKYFKRRDI